MERTFHTHTTQTTQITRSTNPHRNQRRISIDSARQLHDRYKNCTMHYIRFSKLLQDDDNVCKSDNDKNDMV
eukprot:4312028-Amphidinium_carterae.1